MLSEIAISFGGMFGYIPDPTNLGTTFVNAISNILTTAAVNVKINISDKVMDRVDNVLAGNFIRSKDFS